MSEANRTAVAVVEEVTPGTTPANPAFEAVRVKSANLGYNPQTTVSSELRSDRQIPDLIKTGFEAGGDLPTELSYGNLDTLLRGALFSEWVETPVRYNNGTADSKITDVVAGTGVITVLAAAAQAGINVGAFAVGMLVRTSGFTNAGNNFLKRVTAATATSFTVATAGLVNEAAPPGTARAKVVGFEGAAADITATATGLGSTALDFTTLGIAVGSWLKVGGSAAGNQFATAANNDWIRVSAVTAAAITADILPSGWAVDAGAGKSIQVWMGDYLRNGTTKRFFSVELQYQDLTVPEYEYFKGMAVNTLSLGVTADEIVQASVGFAGMSATNGTAREAGATDKAAPTNDVISASSNVGSILENGAAISGANYVVEASININNQLRRLRAVGQQAAAGINAGRGIVTGRLNTYYGSNAILTKIRNGTATSLAMLLKDPSGTKTYHVDLPKIKFTSGDPSTPGVDTDRMLEMDFQAIRHTTLGYTMQLSRFEEYA